jgi:hypothetical protein
VKPQRESLTSKPGCRARAYHRDVLCKAFNPNNEPRSLARVSGRQLYKGGVGESSLAQPESMSSATGMMRCHGRLETKTCRELMDVQRP